MTANTFEYLEIQLVDHCNLNCKGCSHFSPISKPFFLDLQVFKKDLTQLKKTVTNIKQLRLMGGEPFLHPHLIDFLEISRYLYPSDKIAIVTNGILLEKIKKKLWKSMTENRIEIHVTVYPSKKHDVKSQLYLLKTQKIIHEIEYRDTFFKNINLNEKRDNKESISICRSKNYCPALKDGKIFQCSGLGNIPVLLNYINFNEYSKPQGLDIYDKDFNFNRLMTFLNTPDPLCSHCFYAHESYPWSLSNKDKGEWLI